MNWMWFKYHRVWSGCMRSRKSKSRLLAVIGGCLFFVVLHFILAWESTAENMYASLSLDIPDSFVPVQTQKRETFPVSGQHKIPKIIHQTWKDTNVPQKFVKWIKSWLEFHPDWEYYLWTDDSARQLIAKKYPNLLSVFDGYQEPIRRADALRYVVLYEYGGLYVDMDMEALSSLEPLSLKYSCYIGQEPFEHPILDTNFEHLLINALMGCRKGHPFMKMLLDNLSAYSILWHYLDSTGPHFVTMNYRQYLSTNFLPDDHEDGIYVTPSEYFYPAIDPDKLFYMYNKCSTSNQLSQLQVKACRNLKYKSLTKHKFDPFTVAFTNHHWSHTYYKNSMLNSGFRSSQSISDIVPRVKMYKSN